MMPRSLVVFSAAVCILCALFLLLSRTSSTYPLLRPFQGNSASQPFSLESFYSNVPYASSWGSWWHPQRLSSTGVGALKEGWNILYHLGGNGPWIEKIDGIVDRSIAPPEGCTVDMVHMMSRHAERFPTFNSGGRMLALLKRIRDSGVELQGDLAFVNTWEYFTQEPGKHLEQLTTTGPYAGTLEAFTTGVKLRTRYDHLISSTPNTTHFWASDSNRVIDTARYFAAGLFNIDWENDERAILHVIPETSDLGADTLTPGQTCLKYRDDLTYGHDYGAAQLVKFRSTYLGAIGDRFQKQNPKIRFEDAEIYSMQEMCGFETVVRGSSRWCDVFTREDWRQFEYARDVIHYYRSGPGNRYGPTIGWLWLNATANLLSTGPSAGPLFFSFVHDGDIIPMLAALNLFPDSEDLPVTHVLDNRTWRTSQIVPMGGRVIFERLTCPSSSSSSLSSSSTTSSTSKNTYIRINVNDGIVALPQCDSGPGKSCPLNEFLEVVRRRGEEVGDFGEILDSAWKDGSDIVAELVVNDETASEDATSAETGT